MAWADLLPLIVALLGSPVVLGLAKFAASQWRRKSEVERAGRLAAEACRDEAVAELEKKSQELAVTRAAKEFYEVRLGYCEEDLERCKRGEEDRSSTRRGRTQKRDVGGGGQP